ncbi:MAG: sugar transferase [Bacteroidales bacterium]|jgi:lipopolysaccharide/colanic/teichoic acid biosynthesis glycosyltransferase|nr:sugar transferase [Bacteroidales bacterium]
MYPIFFKRFFDLFFSILALIVLLPLLILTAIVVGVEIKENPFFTQQRSGKSEKPFRLRKFKTMRTLRGEQGYLLPDRLRITRSGAFLRKYSLDELPEFWNVICGNMSLVGPRPLLMQYLPYYTERERRRHSVRPGITGLAQISGRNFIDWDKRLELDVRYVEQLSARLDAQIMLQTVGQVFRAEGVSIDSETVEPYLNEIRATE